MRPIQPWTVLQVILGIILFYHVPVCLAEYSGLLLSTLRSHFIFACENEIMSIKCPESTEILIESANYGRQVKEMCPFKWSTIGNYQLNEFSAEDTNCRAEKSLQPVLTLCHTKPKCKFRVDTDLFGDDPCPGTTKYLDITYKCVPSRFDSIVICEDNHLQLHCTNNEILAINSVMFGRSRQGTMECPSYTMQEVELGPHHRDCQSSTAYEEILIRCHGRKHCAVKASTRVFGDPCLPGTHKYLAVFYSCVSKTVFRKPRRYSGLPEQPSNIPNPTASYVGPGLGGQEMYSHDMYNTEHPNYSSSIYEGKGEDSSSSSSDISVLYVTDSSNSTVTTGDESDTKVGLITSIIQAIHYIKENKETVILYFVVGCLIGIVLTLLWCVCRIKLHNKKLKKKVRGTGALTQLDGPNNETRNNGIMEIVRQENRVDIDEIWRSPPPPSITSRGTDTRPTDTIQSRQSSYENTYRNGTETMSLPRGLGRTPPPSTGSQTLPRGTSSNTTGTLTLPRGIGSPGGPRNGLSTSSSLTFGNGNGLSIGLGNGLGLMLDGIDLSDLWNANTLPGSRNLNSYFP